MKLEIQFARDTSTLLPKTDPHFKIQTTNPKTGKKKPKTQSEFGDALKSLLGKRSNRSRVEYASFKETLERMTGVYRNCSTRRPPP
jgi:hypothetical protein